MKKILLIALMVIALAGLLTGCKGKATPAPLGIPELTATPIYDQFDYLAVMMQCQPDKDTGSMACYIVKDNDNTSLEGYLKTMGTQGWDLVQMVQQDQGGKDGGYMTAVFKRAKVRHTPVPVVTPTP
jgi:hypothetical protein